MGRIIMKGYYEASGYRGYTDGHYQEYASDTEYYEIMEEREKADEDQNND